MLGAARRALRPGGRIAFHTIELADDVAPVDLEELARSAPPSVASPQPYDELLAAAGFRDIGRIDVTDGYLVTLRAWLAHSTPLFDLLVEVDGEEAVTERIDKWRHAIAAVEAGWLRRSLYWATCPERRLAASAADGRAPADRRAADDLQPR